MTSEELIDLVHRRDELARRLADFESQLRQIDHLMGGVPPAERLAAVVTEVAASRGITVYDLKHGGRSRALVAARDEAAWKARRLRPTPSYPEIRRALGMCDHTVAMDAVRRHQRRMDAEAAAKAA